MTRPPCCDKVGIKKGPWTPEEDIILVSYVQDNGPGNWRSVPTNTGLMRCSKSCRLRWTNYLRPGIKRGGFTKQEEGLIIHLQALLGNRWAAIASYLPQRTDNDIKNYWNTHLKKRIKKVHASYGSPTSSNPRTVETTAAAATTTITYASSTENISRLLEDWMRHPKKKSTADGGGVDIACKTKEDSDAAVAADTLQPQTPYHDQLSLEDIVDGKVEDDSGDHHPQPPFSLLEQWLLEEGTAGQSQFSMEELMKITSGCFANDFFQLG